MEDIVNGEPKSAIVEENKIVDEAPKGLTMDDVKKLMEEERRKYQSQLDKVIAEKKTVESKALTVEERMAHLEAERKSERLTWARDAAKAKAGIDADLESAILSYASDDASSISESAEKIAKYKAAIEAPLKARIEELEKKLQYGAKAPAAGSSGAVDFAKMTQFEATEYCKRSPENLAAFESWRKTKR